MDAATRRFVRLRADGRCEYCRIHEDDEAHAFHLEHIVPKKHGGTDRRSNLAWSCHHCNLGKGPNLSGRVRGQVVTLFHPRGQQWNRHFRWPGPILIGKTRCGQATIQVLNINDADRVTVRSIPLAAGLFPPF